MKREIKVIKVITTHWQQ